MIYNKALSKNTIRSSCSFFVCKFCLTKSGWEHQKWCEINTLTSPECKDCQYFNKQAFLCQHPALKKDRKEDLQYEKNKCTL